MKNVRDLYRGISDFKRGYQPRNNRGKDEKGDLVADSNSILARWMYIFSQLLEIHEVDDVIQIEIHTAEPHVPEMSVFQFVLAFEELNYHKSPGVDQIPVELI
jgi:hypothetical protein